MGFLRLGNKRLCGFYFVFCYLSFWVFELLYNKFDDFEIDILWGSLSYIKKL